MVPGTLTDVGELTLTLGGSVANTGTALANLGAEVHAHARVGDDRLGGLLTSLLGDTGIDTTHIEAHGGTSTSYSLVLEQPGVDRAFWHHTGANALFDGASLATSTVDLLHVGYPALLPALVADGASPLRSLLHGARQRGATTSVDLSVVDPRSPMGAVDWRRTLETLAPSIDLLSPSLDDLTSALQIDEGFSIALVDRLSQWLVDAGVGIVAISAGASGLFVRTADASRFHGASSGMRGLADSWADRSLHQPALTVENPVTTNGAGDASSAGLAFAVAGSATLEEALLLASTCSAALISGRRPTPDVLLGLSPDLSTVLDGTFA